MILNKAPLLGKHVQISAPGCGLAGYQLNGILQESELDALLYIKLCPWDEEFSKKYPTFMAVPAEVHILTADIKAIVNLDTIDEKQRTALNSKSLGVSNNIYIPPTAGTWTTGGG
jgi:hypothetical protein